jgi:hypothetical protein
MTITVYTYGNVGKVARPSFKISSKTRPHSSANFGVVDRGDDACETTMDDDVVIGGGRRALTSWMSGENADAYGDSSPSSSFGSPASDASSWATPVFGVAIAVSACAMAYFASPSVSIRVRAQVGLAWALSIAIVGVVPVDVSATMRLSGSEGGGVPSGLPQAFDMAYWGTYALTWLILPLHQAYEDAADFNTKDRIKRAVREKAMFVAIIVALLGVGTASLMASEKLSLGSIRAAGIVLANVWGISTGVLLMGFGLVDIPKTLWNNASFSGRLTRAYKHVAGASRSLTNAHENLAKQVTTVATTSSVMPRRHELRWAMSIIEKEAPEFSSVHRVSVEEALQSADEDILDYDYDELNDLVALRKAVRRSVRVYNRTKAHYALAVEEAFHAESLEQSKSNSMRRLHRLPNSPMRTGSAGRCVDNLEYTWCIVILPLLLRIVAIGLAFFSGAIILAESTIWVSKVWEEVEAVSLMSVMLENARSNTQLYIAVAFPLFYMCLCTFYALFKLGMFSFYQLVPRHTDAFSLLVNAGLVCRYSAPIAFNFLMCLPVIRESGKMTTFSRKMTGNVPELATELNVIVPTFLGLFCAAIALGWFDVLARVFHAGDGFKFESDRDVNENVDAGKAIVDRERAEIADGGVVGSAHECFVADDAPYEQQLPAVLEDSVSQEERREAQSNLLSGDPESASDRWETQKTRLSRAVQQSMERSPSTRGRAPAQPSSSRNSPLNEAGRQKLSKLDSMFSSISRRNASFSDD